MLHFVTIKMSLQKEIEENVRKAMIKSFENPGQLIMVDRSWAQREAQSQDRVPSQVQDSQASPAKSQAQKNSQKTVLRPIHNQTMRLTDEMNAECNVIKYRLLKLREKFYHDAPFDSNFHKRWNQLKFHHGDELESYKFKLENFYSDTDVKEKFKPKFWLPNF